MTLEELLAREGIRQTMVTYTMAGDRLRTEEFMSVFTEDAILETDGVPSQDAFRFEGREAIRGWIASWRNPPVEGPVHGSTFIRHHLSTSQLELTGPDAAKARTYWTAYTDIGPDHCGYYLDVFRKEQDRWLIAHRRVRLNWRSERSLYMTAVARTKKAQ